MTAHLSCYHEAAKWRILHSEDTVPVARGTNYRPHRAAAMMALPEDMIDATSYPD